MTKSKKKMPVGKILINKNHLLQGTLLITMLLFAADTYGTLEAQLDKVNTLATGKFLKTGLAVTTIAGFIGAVVKGSVGVAIAIVGIGIILAYYLGWVQSNEFIQHLGGGAPAA